MQKVGRDSCTLLGEKWGKKVGVLYCSRIGSDNGMIPLKSGISAVLISEAYHRHIGFVYTVLKSTDSSRK